MYPSNYCTQGVCEVINCHQLYWLHSDALVDIYAEIMCLIGASCEFLLGGEDRLHGHAGRVGTRNCSPSEQLRHVLGFLRAVRFQELVEHHRLSPELDHDQRSDLLACNLVGPECEYIATRAAGDYTRP